MVRRLAALVALSAALFAGCGGPPTPKDQADATRAAMPKCQAGDTAACATACENGGSNDSCKRACNAGSAIGCASLASRLEHGKDADDALSPVRDIGEQDPELVTQTFQLACEYGHGPSCMAGAGRILNGQGRGKLGGEVAISLLKRGCEKLRDAGSCCAMGTLNHRLAQSKTANVITDFAGEAKRWRAKAKSLGTDCPEDPVDPPVPPPP